MIHPLLEDFCWQLDGVLCVDSTGPKKRNTVCFVVLIVSATRMTSIITQRCGLDGFIFGPILTRPMANL